MTTSRTVRGLAALAAGALLWGVSAGPAAADQIREGQWALKNYGADTRVWPISQGEGVIVAVVDSGVDASHPDLAGQVLPGFDITGGSADGRTDTDGHGTAMASDIAAHGHGNNEGAMGLAPKAKILPIRVSLREKTQADGGSSDADIAKGIRYAVDHNAKVINMSFAGAGFAPELRSALEYAVQKDVVLVGGSGNTPGIPVSYPAAAPGVVAVSGVTEQGDLWAKSTTGPQITLAAPAEHIMHADLKQGYASGDGTSDAAAFVSAVAALVRSKYPDLSAGQVINRMIKSAVQPKGQGSFPNDKYGYGIASPSGALAANPAVDNGPKENPLLGRAEPDYSGSAGNSSAPSSPASKAPSAGAGNSATPQASGDAGDKKSNTGMLVAVGGGVLAVIVIVVVVVLVRRSKNNGGNGGGPGGPGGPGASGGPGGPGYGYQQQPAGYGYPQGQQVAGYPQQQAGQPGYPPQPPAGGNPYQS
ncbi:type VII secretion-associated serine protease mycosin [Kitasatospora sp. NPDC088783]|uniref:type VII secretion-associated serine protease mycosin n=1 Tax=Kitasatospora sp. NPDC088783 TaxID=3364077 RepID=UPI003803E73F